MKKYVASILGCVIAVCCYSQELILNEVVAKNVRSYVNKSEESPDWIEIKNVTPNIVNMSEYSISNHSKGTVVPLPKRNISGGAVLLLEMNEANGLFSLDASSDTLLLFKNGKLVDEMSWNNLPADVSIGRSPKDYSTSYYFPSPTPKKQNVGTYVAAKTLSAPKVDKPAGIYQHSFEVNVFSSENKSELRYTLDGSEPTETSSLVRGSIQISDNANLRVKAFRSGYLPSATTTVSYIFTRFVTLPIASITVENRYFWDKDSGIYVEGPNADIVEPYFGANYWQDWEVPVHLDFFDKGRNLVLSQDLGCKIGGNWSRAHPQKTLRLYARDEYGKNEMDYQFFKDKPISSFHMILLRNSGNDFNNTQMRDGVISELAKQMNIDRQAYQPAVVYINGEYFGIQNVREKQKKHYIAENYGYDKDDIDIIRNGGELISGTADDYWRMRNFIENTDLSIDVNYQKAKTYIDVPNFIDYNVLEMYVVNEDWPGNNIQYWHSRSANTPWRYLLFDADFGLGIWELERKVNLNMLEWSTEEEQDNYARAHWAVVVLNQFLKNNDFRRDFMNATADRLNTTFSPQTVRSVIDSVYELIEFEMPYHIKRWGNNWQDGWLEQMREFAGRREAIMRKQTEDFFSTGGSYDLTLDMNVPEAGKIHLNTIDVNYFPWSGKYFNNNTITLSAIPNPGYEFVRWEGAVSSTCRTITLTTDVASTLTAVFNYVGNIPKLLFAEAYYHPLKSDETEWLNLYNEGNHDVDLSNWTIVVDRYNQTYTIPKGTVISSGSFLLFANNLQKFNKNYTIAHTPVLGDLTFDFPKDFATITLRNTDGIKIASMYYSDEFPYAQKADGYGYSFEYMYDSNEFDEESMWRAYMFGGNPERLSKMYEYEGVEPIINEINYASGKQADSGDWIEIYNPNETITVNLKDWMIRDKDGNLSVIYDDVQIPPQGYVVFADNPEKFHSIYPQVDCHQLKLSLNNYVDDVELYHPDETLSDKVSYSMFDKNWTKSAFETGRTLSFVNTENDNNTGLSWRASNTYGTPGASNDYREFVESVSQNTISIYPNPCEEYVVIHSEGEFVYKIVSSKGAVVKMGNGNNEEVVFLQNLPSGSYLIVLNGAVSGEFVKDK